MRKVPTAKVRGKTPDELHISTKKPAKPQQQQTAAPTIQAPPQSEMLASEYVHNLQQQLYVLNAELRFLSDRSGAEQDPDGMSVDASIRRLRRACAMHEEETNKKAQEYEQQINKLNEELGKINEERAVEVLSLADEREKEGLENLENAFVEMASEVLVRQMEHECNELFDSFSGSQKDAMARTVQEKKAHLQMEQKEAQNVQEAVSELRDARKAIVDEFRESIRNKKLKEEQTDILMLLANEPERPPENVPIATITAKNAKIEMELKAALAERNQIEHQVDLLLEKNVRLKAELNRINRDLETAKYMKEIMDKQYTGRFEALKKADDEQQAEILAMKRSRREMKAEIQTLTDRFNQMVNVINKSQSEQEYNQSLVEFYTRERAKVNEQNEQTKKEIHIVTDRICDLRAQMDGLARQIADAGEERRSVEVLVEINNKDPRCVLNETPPELQQLFDSLTAVKQAIQ